jgi:hypothetical protein
MCSPKSKWADTWVCPYAKSISFEENSILPKYFPSIECANLFNKPMCQ